MKWIVVPEGIDFDNRNDAIEFIGKNGGTLYCQPELFEGSREDASDVLGRVSKPVSDEYDNNS